MPNESSDINIEHTIEFVKRESEQSFFLKSTDSFLSALSAFVSLKSIIVKDTCGVSDGVFAIIML